MTGDGRRRGRAWPIKLPAGWRSTRKSGALLYDVVLPVLLLLLALITIGLILFAVGVATGIISGP